ncbi:MAG TPA: hypothetical protein DCF96_08715 [Rhodobacteraceae bacterium]|nr:hypothetical protein [Paracoccaceae bacterium]
MKSYGILDETEIGFELFMWQMYQEQNGFFKCMGPALTSRPVGQKVISKQVDTRHSSLWKVALVAVST